MHSSQATAATNPTRVARVAGRREIQVRGKAGIFAVLAATAAIGVYVLPAFADEPPAPIVGETLTGRAVFTDDIDLKLKIKTGSGTIVINADDPSQTVVVRYTVQPGARFPWHSHAGPVLVNIVSGALTYIDPEEGCAERTYTAGQAFVDAGHGHVHSAYNPTSSPMVLVATFFEAPASGPLLIPADPAC